jgi:hypothetical protein
VVPSSQFHEHNDRLLDNWIDPRIPAPNNLQGSPMLKHRTWTRTDVKPLRTLAGRKTVKVIGRALRRTEAAVRFKAHTKRIKLAMK